MKRFYIQVNSPDGVANFVIRHKKVKNEYEAIDRVKESYRFNDVDILRVSEKRLPTDYSNFSAGSYRSLSYFVDALLSREEEVYVG